MPLVSLLAISLSVIEMFDTGLELTALKPYWSFAPRQFSVTTSPVPSPTPAPVLNRMVLSRMVQFGPESWFTAMASVPGTKFSMVRYSMVTPEAVPSKADWLMPSPLRTAPGAPSKTSPALGSICPKFDDPRVWVPAAKK